MELDSSVFEHDPVIVLETLELFCVTFLNNLVKCNLTQNYEVSKVFQKVFVRVSTEVAQCGQAAELNHCVPRLLDDLDHLAVVLCNEVLCEGRQLLVHECQSSEETLNELLGRGEVSLASFHNCRIDDETVVGIRKVELEFLAHF